MDEEELRRDNVRAWVRFTIMAVVDDHVRDLLNDGAIMCMRPEEKLELGQARNAVAYVLEQPTKSQAALALGGLRPAAVPPCDRGPLPPSPGIHGIPSGSGQE